ncbi:MAG: anthranilate synthase component I family protein [Planctomycetota bacterium]
MISSPGPFDAPLAVELLPKISDLEPLLAALEPHVDAAVLESGQDVAGTGEWHVLVAGAVGEAKIIGSGWEWSIGGVREGRGDRDPVAAVAAWWELWRSDLALPVVAIDGVDRELPFAGGAIGVFGYELGEQFETVKGPPPTFEAEAFRAMPDLHLRLYDEAVVIHAASGAAFFVHRHRVKVEERRWWERRAELSAHSSAGSSDDESVRIAERVSIDDASYLAAVDDIRSKIERGEVYEVNLTRCHRVDGAPSAWELYRRLRVAQPVPYAALLPWSPVGVVSASPECFLRVRGRSIETRPIKGTAPRTGDPVADATSRETLRTSDKERAELAMIIDLERNDLGRVCRAGSVEVVEEAALEAYATVYHNVATVRGELRDEVGPFEVLAATFPGGSITGAPKIAAMTTIRELEPCPRKAYTGSVGWLGPNGDLELSIAIRTVIEREGTMYFSVGGAVTWDSVPEHELAELEAKGRAIFTALRG